MNVPKHDRQRGAGLAIVVVAAGLVAAIVAATTTMLHNQTKERVLNARKVQRNAAYEMVKKSLEDPNALMRSAYLQRNVAGVKNLYNCIFGNPNKKPGDCHATERGDGKPTMRAFKLYVPFSPKKVMPISGINKNDTDGAFGPRGQKMSCSSFSADCPYAAMTYFWAQCPDNAARCGRARRIFTFAQIHQVRNLPNMVRGTAYPTEATRLKKPYDDASFSLTDDLVGSAYMACPDGAIMVGTSEEKPISGPTLNVAKCECAQGYMLDTSKGVKGYDPATKWPYCKLAECDEKKGQVLSKIDAVGQIECGVPKEDDYICVSRSTPSNGVVNCPKGAKMRGLLAGDDCIIPKDSNVVQCPKMVIKCCTKIK